MGRDDAAYKCYFIITENDMWSKPFINVWKNSTECTESHLSKSISRASDAVMAILRRFSSSDNKWSGFNEYALEQEKERKSKGEK